LQSWVKLQNSYDCFFFVADWHALTTDYDNTARLADSSLEVVLDFLAAGLDPEKCAIFVQSHVKQHAELHLLFSMITPLGWLERVPTYKEQQQEMPNKELHMYGFLGYPLLQAADILIYRAGFVPVGADQDVHVELTREVARRFNQFYKLEGKPVFPEPQTLLTPTPKLLGMDKRKMSKSYGNSILLSDEAAVVEQKIKGSVTDRPRLTDRGNPSQCPVGNLHQIFSDSERLAYITQGCTQASITCVECKALAVESVNQHLAPIRERRHELAQNPARLQETILHGAQKAAAEAEETMAAVREAVGLLRLPSQKSVAPQAVHPFESLQSSTAPLRVPESIAIAKNDDEKWELRAAGWLERVGKTNPLKKDRPRTYITRKGRKVGVYAAEETNGIWTFRLEDRPINVLVLLAQDKDRFLHDYVLPPKVLQECWKKFARTDGNVEVVMKRTAASAALALPEGDLPIQQYQGDTSALQ
ncbi:MAG TPA: tryptophan--tRNA ligase, partial [Candidatus Angelobacter sp.]|nr:tryptophan--tRNA ligase [Candidatus Angelobacter sp.]